MSPSRFVQQMRENLLLKDFMSPKQIMESQEFLDHGFKQISKRLEENYHDMTPEAVEAAHKLQGFLLVFLEYSNNFSLLKKMEA